VRVLLAVIHKEFLQVFRDRPMLAILFLVPFVQLFVFAYAVTNEVKHISLMVVDFDRSQESRKLIDHFVKTEQFDLKIVSDNVFRIRDEMKAWHVQAALVIPPDFSEKLVRKQRPQVGFIIDGVDGNAGIMALAYARGVLERFHAELLPTPQYASLLRQTHQAIVEDRMWFNPDLSSQQYMVPGIVVTILTIIPLMLTAMGIVKEKEIGTMEQLMVTPIRKWELILAKILPFLILAYVELSLVMAAGVLYFQIPMQGSYLLLALLSFIYLFAMLGMGIFVSTVTQTQQQAMFVAWFSMVVMLLLSGFFIPIANMPDVLQKITYLNPMRYFMSIIRDIFQKGSSLQHLWGDVLPMSTFCLLIFGFSIAKFQKRIQ